MEFSEHTQDLFKALANAQADLGKAAKDGNNPHYRSKYATLESVRDVVMPCFNAHGLSISQHPGLDGDNVTMTTVVGHESGQWMRSTAAVPIGKRKDSHAYGSACTYLRRFAMAAVASCVTGEDDDGNAASVAGPRSPSKRAKKPSAVPVPASRSPMSESDLRSAVDLSGFALEEVNDWCKANGKPAPIDMGFHKQKAMLKWLDGAGSGVVKTWLNERSGVEG
jgi:hypothetical protein